MLNSRELFVLLKLVNFPQHLFRSIERCFHFYIENLHLLSNSRTQTVSVIFLNTSNSTESLETVWYYTIMKHCRVYTLLENCAFGTISKSLFWFLSKTVSIQFGKVICFSPVLETSFSISKNCIVPILDVLHFNFRTLFENDSVVTVFPN